MKTIILILTFVCLSLVGVSQTAKKPVKDSTDNYVPCTDCFETWQTRNANQNQVQAPNLHLNNTGKKIFGEVSRPVKIVIATVGGIFLAALVTKTTNMTNAITIE